MGGVFGKFWQLYISHVPCAATFLQNIEKIFEKILKAWFVFNVTKNNIHKYIK